MGPTNLGPMTGRGMGPCGGWFGRGRGFGRGLGFGVAYSSRYPSKRQEASYLKEEINDLEEELKEARAYLAELLEKDK